jgi:hypothetical protein
MKKIMVVACLFFLISKVSFAQEIIKGVTNSVSLVKKSAKLPSIRNKDGSTIVLAYKESEGLMVTMAKNGKSFLFCNSFPNASMVQVCETDMDKDGKPEIIVGARTSPESVEAQVYKKAEFETMYKLWSSFTGVQSFEFPGDGTVKLYDKNGNFGVFKILEDGQLNAM